MKGKSNSYEEENLKRNAQLSFTSTERPPVNHEPHVCSAARKIAISAVTALDVAYSTQTVERVFAFENFCKVLNLDHLI